jgi:preprotein translocase subunit SecA
VITGWFGRQRTRLQRNRYSQRYIVRKVARYEEALQNCTDEALDNVLQELRFQLHRQGLQESLIIEAFAVIREVSGRVLSFMAAG